MDTSAPLPPNNTDRIPQNLSSGSRQNRSAENKETVRRDHISHSASQQQFQNQAYQGQPYSTGTYHQPPIYVLPHPPPPYYSYQHHFPQERRSDEQQPVHSDEGSAQSNQQQQGSRSKTPYQEHASQQSYYGAQPWISTNHPDPNVLYVHQYQGQPPSAQGSPMVRPGPWRGGQRDEPQPEGWEGFQSTKIRRVFVRKVYTILMLQLLVTMAIIALFVFEPNVKNFVRKHIYLHYISLAIFIGVYLGMACFESVRRKFPTNIIVLSIFTLAASYMLGTISSTYNTEAVFMAAGVCAAICLAVTIFSFYTKYDFTSCGGMMCILLLILFLFGLIAIFIPSRTMTMIYAGAGAIVFSLLLAYNTQLLMGGKKYELSPEEYIFAAIQIYVDVINIFLFLLMLFGERE